MYSPLVRIIFCLIGLFLAYEFYKQNNWISFGGMLFAIGLILWGYFKNGTVYIAFQQLKKKNYLKAEKLLSKIKDPDALSKSQRGYYYFTRGFVLLNKEKLDDSLKDLTTALKIGLRTENDTSIVTLNIAAIELEKGNFEESRNYIEKTRSMKLKPMVIVELEKLEKDLTEVQNNN